MWVALVPSGIDWLDAQIGGLPAAGVVAALGAAGAGKTGLALGFAVAQLQRGARVCYLTTETPEAVLETCRGMLEMDLRPAIAEGSLTLLSFAPFFVNKIRSLNSVDPPLAELRELFDGRGIDHVVFDTLDPMLTWIESANAKAAVRQLLGQMQSWGRAVLCTVSGNAPAIAELARTASGSLALSDGKLIVRQAGWCNVYDLEVPLQFVQGRGLVVAANASARPRGPAKSAHDISSVPVPSSPPGPGSRIGAQPGAAPWTSLIGDPRQILGARAAAAVASREIFGTRDMLGRGPPDSGSTKVMPDPTGPRRRHPSSASSEEGGALPVNRSWPPGSRAPAPAPADTSRRGPPGTRRQ